MNFSLKSTWAILSLSLFTCICYNLAAWQFIWKHLEVNHANELFFLASLPLFLFALFNIIYSLICWPYINKVLIPFLLIIGAVGNYATFNLGIFIDSDMVRNVVETNAREASDLITISSILWVVLLGIVPSILWVLLKIKWLPAKKELTSHLLVVVGSIGIILIFAVTSYKEYASFLRNHNEVRRLINPINSIHASYRLFKRQYLTNQEFKTLDLEVTKVSTENKAPLLLLWS